MTDNLQEKYFAEIIQNETFVLIYLKNGIKLSGRIAGHCAEAVFLKDPVLQIVYKSCISTIVFHT